MQKTINRRAIVEPAHTPLTIELDKEIDGRFIAEIQEIPGVITYGETAAEAIKNVKILALKVVIDKLENNEHIPNFDTLIFRQAPTITG